MKKINPTKIKALIALIWLLFLPIEINAQDGNYVETNGVKIYYETHGEGEPLLMLHGITLSHKSWDSWVEDLSKNHQLIIPDLRGHGQSTNQSRVFTHKLSAMDMYGLMDHLNIDRFQAIGYSSGAMTLTHMATMDTSRISSMILVAGTSFYSDLARSHQKAVADGPMPWMEGHHPGGEEQTRMLKTQFRNVAETYDDMNFTPPYLATITCPLFMATEINSSRLIFRSYSTKPFPTRTCG